MNHAKRAVNVDQIRSLVQGKKVLTVRNGITDDIVSEILTVLADSTWQTSDLAKSFREANPKQTAENIHRYIRENIVYRLDPDGVQLIKTPARTILDGFGDCKAYSILACSLLQNVGIACCLRFVSFNQSPTWTHVYAVAKEGNQEYFIDACLPAFNQQKPYTHKKDYMTKIYRVSGLPSAIGTITHDSGLETTTFAINPLQTNEGELDLLLLRERLELEQQIARRTAVVNGFVAIGSTLDNRYERELQVLNAALQNLHNPAYLEQLANISISGPAIGKTVFGKIFSKAKDAVTNVAKTVATGVKNAAEFVGDKARDVVMLPVKAILEITLPKAAPVFLYLFLTPEQLAKAPQSVKNKQAKASRKAKFITNVIGMKDEHFMGIIRNGVMKQQGMTPEQALSKYTSAAATSSNGSTANENRVATRQDVEQLYLQVLGREGDAGGVNNFSSGGLTIAQVRQHFLASDEYKQRMKVAGISGPHIGIAPVALAALPALLEIIGKILSVFGKKDEESFSQADLPDPEADYAEFLAAQAAATQVENTQSAQSAQYGYTSGQSNLPGTTTLTVTSSGSSPENESFQHRDSADSGSTTTNNNPSGATNNNMLLYGGVALALVLLMSKKK